MGRPKKLNYADMFSYNSKTGLYYCTRSVNGQKKKFRSKDPQALYEKVLAAYDAKPTTPRFRDLAEDWWEAKCAGLQENTVVGYAPYYKNAISELGDKRITDIQPADIERIILQMKDQSYSASTVRTQKCVLKMIFDYAITRDNAWITFNPVASVAIPRGLSRKKRSSPEDDVMQLIIDNVDTAPFGLFPYLLLHTGCRRGEALALTWGDIDFKKGQISITKSYAYPRGMPVLKTPKTVAGERTIYLLPTLQQHLVRPINSKDTDLIFHASDGRPLLENAFQRRWKNYCVAVGLFSDEPEERIRKNGKKYIYHNLKPTLTPHELRHGYTTLLIESGVDVKTAQRELGHRDVHTTMQTYADLREKHRAAQLDKLNSYMTTKYGETSEIVDTKADTKPANA